LIFFFFFLINLHKKELQCPLEREHRTPREAVSSPGRAEKPENRACAASVAACRERVHGKGNGIGKLALAERMRA